MSLLQLLELMAIYAVVVGLVLGVPVALVLRRKRGGGRISLGPVWLAAAAAALAPALHILALFLIHVLRP